MLTINITSLRRAKGSRCCTYEHRNWRRPFIATLCLWWNAGLLHQLPVNGFRLRLLLFHSARLWCLRNGMQMCLHLFYRVFQVTFEYAHKYSPPLICFSTAVKWCICIIQDLASQFPMLMTFLIVCEMFFNRCQILYLHDIHYSVFLHDSQHITCWTEFDSYLWCVENRVENWNCIVIQI